MRGWDDGILGIDVKREKEVGIFRKLKVGST